MATYILTGTPNPDFADTAPEDDAPTEEGMAAAIEDTQLVLSESPGQTRSDMVQARQALFNARTILAESQIANAARAPVAVTGTVIGQRTETMTPQLQADLAWIKEVETLVDPSTGRPYVHGPASATLRQNLFAARAAVMNGQPLPQSYKDATVREFHADFSSARAQMHSRVAEINKELRNGVNDSQRLNLSRELEELNDKIARAK